MAEKSGKYWVKWANKNAKNSVSIDTLETTFKKNVKDFIAALETAGATVTIEATKRPLKRASLFHWAWKIAGKKIKASEAKAITGVDIDWVHETEEKSIAAAKEMTTGFNLAIPPRSTVAPSLTSNHVTGKAIDMSITWVGILEVKKRDGTAVKVKYNSNPNIMLLLHAVGKSYGVKKHLSDAPHWSTNGR